MWMCLSWEFFPVQDVFFISLGVSGVLAFHVAVASGRSRGTSPWREHERVGTLELCPGNSVS